MYYLWNIPDNRVSIHLNLALISQLDTWIRQEHGEEARGWEQGAILLGRVREPNEGDYVVSIEQFEPIECSHKRGPSFILSDREQMHLAKRLQHFSRGDLQPVGFFRSHTRAGLYLDQYDFRVMSSVFAHPASVALLVRPNADEPSIGGFFIWEDGDIHRAHSYREFPFDAAQLATGSPIVVKLKATDPADPRPLSPVESQEIAKQPRPTVRPMTVPMRAVERFKEHTARGFLDDKRLRSATLAVAAAIVTLVVIAPFARTRNGSESQERTDAARPHNVYSLAADPTPSGLRLSWNANADRIANARQAVLYVADGDSEQRIELDRRQLEAGSVNYSPSSSEVNFRLDVGGFSESLRANVPVRTATADTPAAPMPPSFDPEQSPDPEQSGAPQTQIRSRRQTTSKPRMLSLPPREGTRVKTPDAELMDPPTIAVTTEVARLNPPINRDIARRENLALATIEPSKPNVLRRAVGAVPGFGFLKRDRSHDDDYVPPKAVRKFHPEASEREDEKVSVKINVDAKGRVSEAELLSKKAQSKLADAALVAATKWRFEPAKRAGKPIPSTLVVHFQF